MARDSLLNRSVEGVPIWKVAIKLVWIAVRLYAVIVLGEQGTLFFYQAF